MALGLAFRGIPWHEGEKTMHVAMKVPEHDNPTTPALSPHLANHVQTAPLIAIGTLDKEGRPWTTLWGGEPGFGRPLGGGILGFRTPVTGLYDPVVEELVGKRATGEVVREEGKGRMVSGLTIDLESRRRNKMYGRMIAGALSLREDEVTGHDEHVAEIQLVVKIEQSLGQCPKYINTKHIVATFARPRLVGHSPQLSQRALDLLAKADLFFISSVGPDEDMDTNNRGGPPGFVRVVSNGDSGAVLCYPEYSGNRLYQTLGNLSVKPLAGICVPDFETGDMLYLTGTTEIFVGKEASNVLLRSNLAVKVTLTAARFVAHALPFRGTEGARSPYTPLVRYLPGEGRHLQQQDHELQQATLLSHTKLTPSVSRFRFSLQNAASYKPGQYVTFDFSSHLDLGYSHMRDDDPQSINDDFVRTFTVSSAPGSPPDIVRRLKDDQFEITIRRVGVVTDFLFKHQGTEKGDRIALEVGIKGFGGDFEVKQDDDETIAFIAAGVGITPVLPSLATLDFSHLKVLWSIRVQDLSLVADVLAQYPTLGPSLYVFITNADNENDDTRSVKGHGSAVHLRRMQKSDMDFGLEISKCYLCTAGPMKKQLMDWLQGRDVFFEDFNF